MIAHNALRPVASGHEFRANTFLVSKAPIDDIDAEGILNEIDGPRTEADLDANRIANFLIEQPLGL